MAGKGGKPAAARKLPPVTVMRLLAATESIDGLIETKADLFAARGARYTNVHRKHTERDLSPDEVAQVAASLGAALGRDDVPELLGEVQRSGLRARDDPPRFEVLLAAGLATAPALVEACIEFVALMEMPPAEFEVAIENDNLETALVPSIRELKRLDLKEANTRARAAFTHLADAAETTPGEALGLILRALGQSLSQAIGPTSEHASLIGSLARTDGADASASTDSPGETRET